LQNRKQPLSRQLINFSNIIREMILEVKITPNSSKNEILRWEENRLVIKIRGIPEKGTVNENLINFLAKTLGIAKSQIEIVAGRTSRLKKLNIQGVSREQITNL
jgi:uncharacterized protein (TIGR00251 family)